MNRRFWTTRVLPWWPWIGLLLVGLTGALQGVAPAILVFAACLLVVALGLLWRSLGELTNEEPLSLQEALDLAAPEYREQEKRSVLRALKDLEQEHRFGKITDAEFAQESARMRQHAKLLLTSLDESMKTRRERVESRIAAFLEPARQKKNQRLSHKSRGGEK